MEEKLRNASREELLNHVLTQRLLIRHLHRRIVELERLVPLTSNNLDSRGGNEANLSPPVPQRDPPPPPAKLSEGLREINRTLRAHATGAVRLPQEVVAEFLYIQKELSAVESGQNTAESTETSALPVTFSSDAFLVSRTPVVSTSAVSDASIHSTPSGQRSGVSRRFSPPSSLIQRTQKHLSMREKNELP
ncbi:hypothetical protein C3747_169g92 [Trypanosoma cruzi]|uniref:Uncharacterized protein n=1 Tax=Trypanosoma cruzi TaxID=5693 RepID=A0A2V2WAT1_TRYCR|nr:hypothetical protein C3747_169g92 [Trypanosoma cruzi]RNC31452.1 hypothetical protein TcCL_Unassigned06021 [Trypanosoma cruzi]